MTPYHSTTPDRLVSITERAHTQDKLTVFRQFVGAAQRAALYDAIGGEERAFFKAKVQEVMHLIDTMPKTYEQEGMGGAALVWLGGAAYLFLTHQTLHGILLAVWGGLLVSLPDNFLRPLIIGRKAKIPTFLLFIGILGGIRAYGFLGILFGPVVVTLLLAFANIYREEFAQKR